MNFNSIRSSIISSKPVADKKGARPECKIDMGIDGNLMLIDIFKILFHEAILEQLAK